MTPSPKFKAIAEKIVSMGGHVHPVTTGEKALTVPNWQNLATRDLSVIAKWAEENPHANVAVVGKPDGLWLFDDDEGVLAEYEATHEPIKTYRVKSVSGGTHLYFLQNEKSRQMGNIGGKNEAGQETWSARVRNRYVISAGSVAYPDNDRSQPLTQYKAIEKSMPIGAPDSFITFLQAKAVKPASPKPPTAIPKTGGSISEGGRNNYLTSRAGKLRQAGAEESEILSALLRINESECNPPLDESEVEKIAHSVANYATRDDTVRIGGVVAGTAIDEPEDVEDPHPYQIVGAERDALSDTVCVFTSEADMDIACKLGFDAVAVLDGQNGTPFGTSITMLKMKYDRAAIFAESDGAMALHHAIDPGSLFVPMPTNYDGKPKTLRGRKVYPKFASLTDALAAVGELDIHSHISGVLKWDAIRKQRLLRNADEVRGKIQLALDKAKEALRSTDPRVVIMAAVDDLRRLQTLDGRFPRGLTETSLHGLLGEFVNIAHPTTEASKELILYEMLPILGAMLGCAYYLPFGSDKHFPSLFTLTIARTSDGKGQALSHCENAAEALDASWANTNIHSNPVSGEGLVRMLAGSKLRMDSRRNRVALTIAEMSSYFNAQARENSTLSAILRNAYDGKPQETFRSDAKKSHDAREYILGLCGMITPKELRKVMPNVDWSNGAANRFLWNIGMADKKLSRSPARPDFSEWVKKVGHLLTLNAQVEESGETAIDYTKQGQETWDDWFYSLPKRDDDILSESQARVAANCARVANLYAQLDERRLDSPKWTVALHPKHVEAGIEIVGRSRQSVEWYLTQHLGEQGKAAYDDIHKLKAAMLKAVRDGKAGLTGHDIAQLFRRKSLEERDGICLQAGLKASRLERPQGGGKPGIIWAE